MIFDHLNCFVLKHIEERRRNASPDRALRAVKVTDQGMEIMPAGSAAYPLAWADITRVAALNVPRYVGNTLRTYAVGLLSD
jgi:hypothetical protein